ncbi:hypothetical protein [Fimbriiglobus ruber]|uniref:Uncharacterized protein n=1 Tax=Fimbriiglobus ruber TaxID=1908690 RepID=A0A225DAU9_9BACT|nr:hypothetical protein [Fimbriiglobus ruber]OWK34426.1 hypothetical protein FRUB_10397 [Fimbriiglobus ruber]
MNSLIVKPLNRPYDYRVLIEAFIYTRRNFVHEDFTNYYTGLLRALEEMFEVRLNREYLSFDQKVLWMLFESTLRSLLQISSPWEGYIDDTLLHTKLQARGEQGQEVYRANAAIAEAREASESSHRLMLYALFIAIFGDRPRVVTSDELVLMGFDDSREPDMTNYYDDL